MKKNVTSYVCGFLSAAFIFGVGIPALASSGVLQQIYVSLEPIKIIIEGQEKNPPSDMQPMIYNGRTYVALRYVGDAFGKEVLWNDTNRTITINAPKADIRELSDSFVNEPMKSNWTKNGGSWSFDGPNGMIVGKSNGNLALDNFFPDAMCDFTVEFEAAYRGDWYPTLFRVYLSKTNEQFTDNLLACNGGISFNNNNLGGYEGKINEYYKVRIKVVDKMANLYLNDKYISSDKITGDKAGFAFVGHTSGDGIYYVRNFKITID